MVTSGKKTARKKSIRRKTSRAQDLELRRELVHRLLTPLTPVMGYLRLLREEKTGPLNPLQHRCLTGMESSLEELRELIDGLASKGRK